MRPRLIKRVTATGDITTGDAHLHSVILTSGADAAGITVRTAGGSGTVLLRLAVAAAGVTAPTGDLGDIACPAGIHVTVDTGTTPSVSVVYT